MLYSKEYKEDYERRFNAYMMLLIKGAYKDFISEKQRRRAELSLDEFTNGVFCLLDILQGDSDVGYNEEISASKLEKLPDGSEISRAIEPLTSDEKSAVFFCVVLEQTATEVAPKLGYKSVSSVTRLVEKALDKIRKRLDKAGGNIND